MIIIDCAPPKGSNDAMPEFDFDYPQVYEFIPRESEDRFATGPVDAGWRATAPMDSERCF